MELRKVESTNIAAAGYDPDSKILRIKFVNGSEYCYSNVPAEVGVDFFEAESVGKYFYAKVRGKYETAREDQIDQVVKEGEKPADMAEVATDDDLAEALIADEEVPEDAFSQGDGEAF